MTSLKRYPDDEKWEQPTHPVYAAEKAALPFGQPFLNLDHVVDYTEQLLSSDWWQEEFPHIQWVWLYTSNNTKYAWTLRREVHLPPFAMNESYLLHELAHVACWNESVYVCHHDKEFRVTFEKILRHAMGDWVADNLIFWYDRFGVPI
jgi:hypothetical protein